MLAVLLEIAGRRPPCRSPRVWERRRVKHFWEVVVQQHFTDELWLKHFRMSRATFSNLCDTIGPFVGPLRLSHRPPVPTDKRVAIAVYKLASCAEYRVVGETFGVSKTTVHHCVYSTCEAIKSKMMTQCITFPNITEAQEIAERNHPLHHVPQVYGSVDGTHIPILWHYICASILSEQ